MKKIFLTITVLFTVMFNMMLTSCNNGQFNEKQRFEHYKDSIRQVKMEEMRLLDSIEQVEKQLLNDMKTPYQLTQHIDSIYKFIYPTAFKNDIHTERFIQYVFMETTTNADKYLNGIPFEFHQMERGKNNKWILHFRKYGLNPNLVSSFFCSNYEKYEDGKLTGEYIRTWINIVMVVPEAVAENMIEGNLYYISGDVTGTTYTLKNGDTYMLRNESLYDNGIRIGFVMNYKDIKEVN